ncbi:MAG: mevalonate kinase [Candidatus Caldarchaeum sp.]
MKQKAAASAPGKVILFGEHFVVSGRPAVVTAINLRAKVEVVLENDKTIFRSRQSWSSWSRKGEPVHPTPPKTSSFTPLYMMASKIMEDHGVSSCFRAEIYSDIPGGAGLGSSAAISTALARALSNLFGLNLSTQRLVEYAMVAEKEYHGRPSGIDPHASAYGGTLLYEGPGKFQPLQLGISPEMLVVFTGLKRKTSDMVDQVVKLASENRREFGELSSLYSEVFVRSVEALKSNNLELLGRLMTINHYLLRALGLSNEVVEKCVEDLLRTGVYGAKLTGAGGGGSVVAVGRTNQEAAVFSLLSSYPKAWVVKTSCPGVRDEN